MNGKKRNGLIVLAVLVVVVAAAAGIWWSKHQGASYQGLASQFPDSVAVFAEIREFGQWMPVSEKGAAVAAMSEAPRGTDPMLQVLSQVWAASPPLKSADLPDLLRNRPMAMGLWVKGDSFGGVALIPLVAGQKALVEKALKGKLGDGPVVATVEGVPLRHLTMDMTADVPIKTLLWGISDNWAVMATGQDDARAVLGAKTKRLSDDPVFLKAVGHFPQDRGGYLFTRGSALARVISSSHKAEKAKGAPEPPSAPSEPQAPGKPTKPAGEAVKPEKAPEAEAKKGGDEMAETVIRALSQVGKEGLKKALSLESIQSMSLWTAPPSADSKGWQVAFWLAYNEQPQGLWRVISDGTPRHIQINGRVPKDGLVYLWGAGKDPARVYQTAQDELQKALPPDQMGWIRAGIGAAEGKLGMSFSNDLLPTLADEWCAVSTRKDGKGEGGDKGHVGFFLTLRDPRRFEDLVANKIAPQLGLKGVTQQGARTWSWTPPGEGNGAISLVVSGGMAILTDDPAWALGTGGEAGKAWKALSDYREKASAVLVMDPSLWTKSNEVLVTGACILAPEGIYADAKFPGEPPSWGKEKCGKGEAASVKPAGESRDRAASGSL